MKRLDYIIVAAPLLGAMIMTNPSWHEGLFAAESAHRHQHGNTKESDKVSGSGKLLPADGAMVKILSPKKEQIFKNDRIPLQFNLIKGRRGHHVHAYVDGELMGMFNGQTGTLTGIKPGNHVLELRVVAEDHQSELDAVDKVSFTVQ
jgi:hypothetical protein